MTVALLDVNVLVALLWPSHVHHDKAHEWFAEHAAEGWATCPLTQLGFVRLSSNPGIIPEAVSAQQAAKLLRHNTGHQHHVFWPDDIPLADPQIPVSQIMGHQQLTDAYLLGLAIQNGGKLVTLDASISFLLPSQDPRRDALEIIGTT